MSKVVIGIASGRKYENYLNWFLEVSDVEIIRLSYIDHNLEVLDRCNGVVLCGGEDVHPRLYKKSAYVEKYQLNDFDEQRDDFEWSVLSYTQQHKLPLLGICRGLQIANVFFGGTLIPDIRSFDKPDHTKFQEGKDRYHQVNVIRHSLLATITGAVEGEVNSAHHQSVAIAGKGLMINAMSPDGIVEGMERKESDTGSYLMLVQWHPERMTDGQNAFSKNIRDNFLESIKAGRK